MKGTLEIEIPPSGNHRNINQIKLGPATGRKPNQYCPFCRKGLTGWMHVTNTQEYRDWLEVVTLRLKVKFRKIEGPVVVSYWVWGGKGFTSARDHDNVMKCLGDALVQAGVIEDDNVKIVKGWRPWYFTPEEHAAKLGSAAPQKISSLRARLYVAIDPVAGYDGIAITKT